MVAEKGRKQSFYGSGSTSALDPADLLHQAGGEPLGSILP